MTPETHDLSRCCGAEPMPEFSKGQGVSICCNCKEWADFDTEYVYATEMPQPEERSRCCGAAPICGQEAEFEEEE